MTYSFVVFDRRRAFLQGRVSIDRKAFPFLNRTVRPTHAHRFDLRACTQPDQHARIVSAKITASVLARRRNTAPFAVVTSTYAPSMSRPFFPTSRNPNQWFRFPI